MPPPKHPANTCVHDDVAAYGLPATNAEVLPYGVSADAHAPGADGVRMGGEPGQGFPKVDLVIFVSCTGTTGVPLGWMRWRAR